MILAKLLRAVCITVVASVLLLCVLSGVGSVVVVRALSRIHIDGEAIGAFFEMLAEASNHALYNGEPDQRVQVIDALGQSGVAARDYVPYLTAATGDPDESVRDAAARALMLIDPPKQEP
jgi:HEAT repeat protein